MDFEMKLNQLGSIPFSKHSILNFLKDYKSPNDKISELLKSGKLISLRRGLYLSGKKGDLLSTEPFLVANHLRGPSYVSLESALSYWGMIPERTYEISSVTTKTSKQYKNVLGRFSYQKIPTPYYSYGIKSVNLSSKQIALVATSEKAICDKIILTSGINLRSIKQTADFLVEDLRIDEDTLKTLNWKIIESWIDEAPKKESLKMLVKTLQKL